MTISLATVFKICVYTVWTALNGANEEYHHPRNRVKCNGDLLQYKLHTEPPFFFCPSFASFFSSNMSTYKINRLTGKIVMHEKRDSKRRFKKGHLCFSFTKYCKYTVLLKSSTSLLIIAYTHSNKLFHRNEIHSK